MNNRLPFFTQQAIAFTSFSQLTCSPLTKFFDILICALVLESQSERMLLLNSFWIQSVQSVTFTAWQRRSSRFQSPVYFEIFPLCHAYTCRKSGFEYRNVVGSCFFLIRFLFLTIFSSAYDEKLKGQCIHLQCHITTNCLITNIKNIANILKRSLNRFTSYYQLKT